MKAWLRPARLGLVGASLWLGAAAAWAGFPARYAPIVVQPAVVADHVEFDLTEALRRAGAERKRLYVYLGASDCPFCRRYEAFLERHAEELVREFAKDYVVVDLRSRLQIKSTGLYFRIGNTALPYAEFMRSIKDERERQLVYPSVWLFDARAKPLMQMPGGTGTFETVPEQLEILNLVQ